MRKSLLIARFKIGCIVLFSFLLFSVIPAIAQTIPASEAQFHIGEYQVVKGYVASTHYAKNSNGKPTFLNVGNPYPNQDFTIVIWGSDRSKFSQAPEYYYNHKTVLVEGVISQYRGVPQIIVKDESQIKIVH